MTKWSVVKKVKTDCNALKVMHSELFTLCISWQLLHFNTVWMQVVFFSIWEHRKQLCCLMLWSWVQIWYLTVF